MLAPATAQAGGGHGSSGPASSRGHDDGKARFTGQKHSKGHGHGKGHGHSTGSHGSPTSTPWDLGSGFVLPLSLEIGKRGSVLVGSAATGAISSLGRGGTVTEVVAPTGQEVAGLSRHGKTLTWGTSVHDETTFEPVSASLQGRGARGTVTQLADTLAFDRAENPDATNTYGLLDLDPACAAQVPPDLAAYQGGVDSHPYGTVTRRGVTYVADAGGNTLLSVTKRGEVDVVAVLPPALTTVTAEVAGAFGLPDCVVGRTLALEPVPTDVEVGRDGALYVTTLPGGPEDGSLGALGSVYRVDPRTGKVKRVATGFSGATGLAIGSKGTIYVSEMFGGKVSKVDRRGKVSTLLTADTPAAIEYTRGKVVVATQVFTTGTIIAAKAR